MAYLVVLVVNNSPHEAGDVISWRPEGSNSFGLKMLQHPWFRVLHVPDMTDEQASALVTPQLGDRRLNPNLKARAFSLGVAQLVDVGRQREPLATKWDGEKFLAPEDAEVTALQVEAARILKAIEEPARIG